VEMELIGIEQEKVEHNQQEEHRDLRGGRVLIPHGSINSQDKLDQHFKVDQVVVVVVVDIMVVEEEVFTTISVAWMEQVGVDQVFFIQH